MSCLNKKKNRCKASVIFVAFCVLLFCWNIVYATWLNLTVSIGESVEVRSYGQLGNQLFEYWSAYNYAKKNNRQLVVDGFELMQNTIDIPMVLSKDVVFALSQSNGTVRKNFDTKRAIFFQRIDMEKDYVRIQGYSQSVYNFNDIADEVRKKTVFKQKPSKLNQQIIKKMHSENSVSIHVRRGDYLYANYTLLSPVWYQKAIAYMNERVDEPFYYIFSDDIEWAKANLDIKEPHMFVTWNRGDESYNDMRLMTHCKHNIIANSTFSWWGAFLGAPEERIVVVPDTWLSDFFGWEHELILPEWTVLPAE